MQKLTSKQRLTLLFSLYVFTFFLLMSLIFIFFFRFTLLKQIDDQVQTMVRDILASHVKVYNSEVSFVVDESGKVLAEELEDASFSAVFFDKDLKLLRGFGTFAFFSKDQDSKELSSLIKLAESSLKDKKGQKVEVLWRGEKIYGYAVPIVFKNEVYGSAIIGRNLDALNTSMSTSLWVLFVMNILGIGGSVILSNIIVSKTFKPVRKLASRLEKVDLDKLDENFTFEGNPHDDFSILLSKFNEMMSRLKLATGIQKQFVSSVSHEIKTPLTKAMLGIEVMLMQKDSSELKEIRTDLMELNNLIDKLLELGKISKVDIGKTGGVSVNEVKISLQKRFKKELDSKNIYLRFEAEEGIKIQLPKEHALILFSNLISNALKFSLPGSSIWFKVRSQDDRTIISIEDEGEGMDKDDLKNIFDRFYQGKTSKKGYGIGLSIVKQICDVYKININVESEKGRGSKFILLV